MSSIFNKVLNLQASYKLRVLPIIFLLALSVHSAKADFDEFEPVLPEHKQELTSYISSFCQGKGKPNARIQNNIVVDCMTSEALWKVEYADNWPQALVKAMSYAIYDDFRGDEENAPKPGVVLVQEDADDYKNMVQLNQIVQHFKLPVKLKVLENYGAVAPTSSRANIKNFQIDFSNVKFLHPK
jgi:hypothetical protein